MIKITCDICMDLLPLVQDNVASADSITVVKQHLETCSECRAMFEGQPSPPTSWIWTATTRPILWPMTATTASAVRIFQRKKK